MQLPEIYVMCIKKRKNHFVI